VDESIQSVLAILVGLLVRFGLPLSATLLAAWALRKLDQRWQTTAGGSLGHGHALGAGTLQVRCWELMECSPEARAHCPAYLQSDERCWQIFRQVEGRLPERCLVCKVFRDSPVYQAA
jgi:hypothetical protein